MHPGTYVYCQTRFIEFHCWPHAPESVKFLRSQHRHEFHVKVTARTKHDNRDIEFITLKLQTDDAIKDMRTNWTGTASCEQMCVGIISRLKDLMIHSVEVSEDGENGAIVVCQ
jgi:hypothetical protein